VNQNARKKLGASSRAYAGFKVEIAVLLSVPTEAPRMMTSRWALLSGVRESRWHAKIVITSLSADGLLTIAPSATCLKALTGVVLILFDVQWCNSVSIGGTTRQLAGPSDNVPSVSSWTKRRGR
jgi:hypothetical protein